MGDYQGTGLAECGEVVFMKLHLPLVATSSATPASFAGASFSAASATSTTTSAPATGSAASSSSPFSETVFFLVDSSEETEPFGGVRDGVGFVAADLGLASLEAVGLALFELFDVLVLDLFGAARLRALSGALFALHVVVETHFLRLFFLLLEALFALLRGLLRLWAGLASSRLFAFRAFLRRFGALFSRVELPAGAAPSVALLAGASLRACARPPVVRMVRIPVPMVAMVTSHP